MNSQYPSCLCLIPALTGRSFSVVSFPSPSSQWLTTGTLDGISGDVEGFLISRTTDCAVPVRSPFEEDDMATDAVSGDAAGTKGIDGTPVLRRDGSPQVPAFLLSAMDDIVATGNNQRLVRCLDGNSGKADITLRDEFRRSLLLFLPPLLQPQQQQPSPSHSEPSSPLPPPPSEVPSFDTSPLLSEWVVRQPESGVGLFNRLGGLMSSIPPLPSALYQLMDVPSFDGVTVTEIPSYSSLPLPHLFPLSLYPPPCTHLQPSLLSLVPTSTHSFSNSSVMPTLSPANPVLLRPSLPLLSPMWSVLMTPTLH